MTKKEQLYDLTSGFKNGECDTVTFCKTFCSIFYPDVPVKELSRNELNEFERLGNVVARFSPFEDDFINCPDAFYNEADVIKAVSVTCDKLFI